LFCAVKSDSGTAGTGMFKRGELDTENFTAFCSPVVSECGRAEWIIVICELFKIHSVALCSDVIRENGTADRV